MKAALVGLLWVASVLIDGDWYVCCKNNGSKQQKQLACKQGKSITAEEQRIMAELENYSKVCWVVFLCCCCFLFFCFLGVLFIMSSCEPLMFVSVCSHFY